MKRFAITKSVRRLEAVLNYFGKSAKGRFITVNFVNWVRVASLSV